MLDIGQHNALEISSVKRNIFPEISKVLLNDIFAEFDWSYRIKNIIAHSWQINFVEFQADDIS